MVWCVEALFQRTQTTSIIYTYIRFPFTFFEPTSFIRAQKQFIHKLSLLLLLLFLKLFIGRCSTIIP